MQSDDTIDSFFAANSDPKFDNLKDESMDVNVSVCSLIPRIDSASTSHLAEVCDEIPSEIPNSRASFFTAFQQSSKLDKNAKNEQNLPSTVELFASPMVEQRDNKNAPASKTKIVYTCNNCARTFISRLEFDKHYRSSYNQEPLYTCNICNRSIQNMRTFRGHYTRHNSLHIKCKLCTKKFSTDAELLEHGKFHTTNLKMLQCNSCDLAFERLDDFNQHCSEHSLTAVAKQRWKCPDCGKFFLTRNNLFIHSKIHKEERNYECSICPQKFVQKVNLINHVKAAHTGDRPFVCEECRKSFVGKSQLLRHQMHHLDVRTFKCSTCGKMYKTENDLKMHNVVHSEQRPYVCTHCGKSFLSTSKLRQHYNIHTGSRPHKCKYCIKDFTNYPNWMKHVRRCHKVDHKTGEPLLLGTTIGAKIPQKLITKPTESFDPPQLETVSTNLTVIDKPPTATKIIEEIVPERAESLSIPSISTGFTTNIPISSDLLTNDDSLAYYTLDDLKIADTMCMQQPLDDKHITQELELYACAPQNAHDENFFINNPMFVNDPNECYEAACTKDFKPTTLLNSASQQCDAHAVIPLPPITTMTTRLNLFEYSKTRFS